TAEPLYIVAAEKHGLLAMTHTFGTLADGGEFEQVYVSLALFHGDRFAGMELFEPERLDVARARFEELRPRTSPSVQSHRTDAAGAKGGSLALIYGPRGSRGGGGAPSGRPGGRGAPPAVFR